jgi:hypothetical protein
MMQQRMTPRSSHSRMTSNLRKDTERQRDVQFRESHGYDGRGEEGDDGNLDDLLVVVCYDTEDWDRVARYVVTLVDEPEEVDCK